MGKTDEKVRLEEVKSLVRVTQGLICRGGSLNLDAPFVATPPSAPRPWATLTLTWVLQRQQGGSKVTAEAGQRRCWVPVAHRARSHWVSVRTNGVLSPVNPPCLCVSAHAARWSPWESPGLKSPRLFG